MRSRRPTTRCWKCGAARTKCATCRTSPTFWSIPKARWNGATTGRRPHALLVGAILHVLYAGEDKTLRGVANFLSDPGQRPFELTLHRMMTTKHLGDAPHPVVASAAREVLNKSDNERSGVLSTAMSFLGLYRDPTVAEVTSRCDWRIADLIDAEHPVSLYLVVPPSDISRTKPLIRLILNQIGRRLTESLDGRTASRAATSCC
jgi:type IV secretion system protein VirD4